MMRELLRDLLLVIIPLASFVTGLQAQRGGEHLWHRPAQLGRDLLAVLLLVPLWVVVLTRVIPLPLPVHAGLLIAALCLGIGPVASVKQLSAKNPRAGEALELNLIMLVIAIAYVPLAAAGAALLFGRQLPLDFGAIAKVVLARALVPLLLGIGVARLAPKFAVRGVPIISKFVNVTTLLIVLVALVALRRELVGVGGLGWLTAVVAAAGAAVIGHLLGGADAQSRGVLAVASVMRFPALALTIAQALPNGRRVLPGVLAYVMASLLVVTAYGMLTKRRQPRQPRLVKPLGASPRTA
jgi:predicted Na+-dependent transporter